MMTGRENELAAEGWNYLVNGLLDKVQAILRELRELRELKDWMMQVFGDVRDVRDVRQNTCVLTTTVPYRRHTRYYAAVAMGRCKQRRCKERRRHRREKRAARKRAKRMRERKGGECVWKS